MGREQRIGEGAHDQAALEQPRANGSAGRPMSTSRKFVHDGRHGVAGGAERLAIRSRSAQVAAARARISATWPGSSAISASAAECDAIEAGGRIAVEPARRSRRAR